MKHKVRYHNVTPDTSHYFSKDNGSIYWHKVQVYLFFIM